MIKFLKILHDNIEPVPRLQSEEMVNQEQEKLRILAQQEQKPPLEQRLEQRREQIMQQTAAVPGSASILPILLIGGLIFLMSR